MTYNHFLYQLISNDDEIQHFTTGFWQD